MRYLIGMLGALLLLATACGGVAQEVGGMLGDGADAVELGSRDGSGPALAGDSDPVARGDDAGDDRADDAGADDGADEARPEAVQPPPAPAEQGVQTISAGEAGEVDVRIVDSNRLELVEVREAAGWTHRVDDLERREIELDFRHDGGRVLELEIELEDGRLEVELG